jgi:hypothetical protein
LCISKKYSRFDVYKKAEKKHSIILLMKTELNDFEKELLNRIIPTQTFSDSKGVQIALRNFIADEKDKIMEAKGIDERSFRSLQSQTVKNIFQYLIDFEFVGEREGSVFFLTEKGKNLRRQRSLEGYEVWRKETRTKNKEIIKTIETRGYLDQDEIVRNRRMLMYKRIKKFIVYPILLIILLVLLISAAHHYNLDKDLPFIKNLFNKEEVATEKKGKAKHAKHKKSTKSNKNNEQ